MKLAIEEAKKSSEDRGCGAVIVKDGKVIAKAHNTQREIFDASAHAEINAIREAGKKLKNKYLDGCTIYCTIEPCIMCLAALSYARIKRIVYGLTLRKVFPEERIFAFDIDVLLSKSPRKIEVVKNFMEDECKESI